MTTIKQKLTDEMKVAMKNKDSLKLSTIRLMLDRIQKKEKDDQKEFNDQDVIQVLQTFKKQIEEERSYVFKNANLAQVSRLVYLDDQIIVVTSFLPKQKNKEEIKNIAKEILNRGILAHNHNKASAMKLVMSELKGKADNKLISEAVDEILKNQ